VNVAIARIRAVIGVAFAVVGVVIIGELLVKPVPLNQKLMGTAFAAVLVALGIVRVRTYLAARRLSGS
jgi:hypothetical protein